MRGRWLAVSAVVLATTASITGAVECTDDDSIESCIIKPQAKAATEAAAEKALAAKTTPSDSFGSRLASALKDFNPFFKAFIKTSQVSEDGKSLTVDFNLKPFGKLASGFQLQGIAREPEVYEALKLSIPEATRAATVDALGNEFGNLDDITAVLSWSLVNSSYGREAQDTFSSMLLKLDKKARHDAAGDDQAAKDPAQLLVDLAGIVSFPADGERMKFKEIPDSSNRAQAKRKVEQFRDLQEKVEAKTRDLAQSTHFFAMVDLVNNQPQLYASGSYRSRDEIAGPDEIALKVTYEHGFANLNGLRRYASKQTANKELLDNLATYTTQPRTASALKHGDRIAFSAEYTQLKSLHVLRPANGVTFDLDSSHALVASFAYGRYLSFDSNGKEVGRFDAKADWEDYGGDPTRQSRAVASVAYTQKISDDWSLPIGLTWASKDEFVGDVQKKLTAHLGLSYKLPWKK